MANNVSIQELQSELTKLEKKRTELESRASILSDEIQNIDSKLSDEKEKSNDLKAQKMKLLDEKKQIENVELKEVNRKSDEFAEKIVRFTIMKEKSLYDSYDFSSQDEAYPNEIIECIDFFNTTDDEKKQHRMSEQLSPEQTEREANSMPTKATDPLQKSNSLSNASQNSLKIPSEIIKTCDSYDICSSCNYVREMKELDDRLIRPSRIFYELPSKSTIDLSQRYKSKQSMREVLNRHSQSSQDSSKRDSEVLLYSSPSINICRECSSLYPVCEKSSPHLPLCMSIDLCNNCFERKKSSKKSSMDVLLTQVSRHSSKVIPEKTQSMLRHSEVLHDLNEQCERPCLKERNAESIRPLTVVHASRRSLKHSTNIKKTRSDSDLEHEESHASMGTLYQLSKGCQSRDVCNDCAMRYTVFDEQMELKQPKSKLSQLISSCESHGVCDNCAKIALMKRISTRTAEHPIDNCKSLNECHNCQGAMRKSLIQRASTVRQSIISTSCQSYQEPKRHTTTPTSAKTQSTEAFRKSLKSVPSILKTCPSYGICEECTECLIDISRPTKSFVKANCMSHEFCNKCADVLQELQERKRKKSNKKSSSYRKSSHPSHKISVKKISSSDSDDQVKGTRKRSKQLHKRNQVHSDSSAQRLYDEIKDSIDRQNVVISKIQKKINRVIEINSADDILTELRDKLNVEKLKLEELIQVAMYEQRLRKDDEWKPIKISHVD